MIHATNTCPVDTALQMLYCMWTQKLIPHQIIEDFEPILSKSLSLIKGGNHAYARVLFINDAHEKCTSTSDKFVTKTIVQTKEGSHSETWDCWGACWWCTQQINQLFKTGEFTREYGECELGPKCSNNQKLAYQPMRAFKGRFLLHGNFPINGLQKNAINKCLFEKECSYLYLKSGSKHLGTRAVKYDLNFSSLPWILCIGVK